jgi:hypothetical protein
VTTEDEMALAAVMRRRIRTAEIQRDNADARLAAMQAEVSRKLATLKTLRRALIVQTCERAGLDAYIAELLTGPSTCAALADTGKRFKNGRPVTPMHLAYIAAHDEYASSIGAVHLIEKRRHTDGIG